MAPRYPSLLQPPITFARRPPGPAKRADTLGSFRQALDQGATGWACEVHLSEDGEAIVHDGPALRTGLRRTALASLAAARVPPSIPRLDQLYDAARSPFHLAVTLVDEVAAGVVAAVARAAGGGAEERLWLCSPDWRQAASWRACSDGARLVEIARLRAIDEGPERRAATLAAGGVDAIELRESDWNAGLTTLFHRFGRLALAGPTAHRHRLDAVLDVGVDGVTSDRVDSMVAAVAASAGPG